MLLDGPPEPPEFAPHRLVEDPPERLRICMGLRYPDSPAGERTCGLGSCTRTARLSGRSGLWHAPELISRTPGTQTKAKISGLARQQQISLTVRSPYSPMHSQTPLYPLTSLRPAPCRKHVSSFSASPLWPASSLSPLATCRLPHSPHVTFGSDRIRTYRGRTKIRVRRVAIDYPHQNACRRKRDQEQRRLKTAGAEPEFPSVPKEPQRETRRDK